MNKIFILAVSVTEDKYMTFVISADNEEEGRKNAQEIIPEGWVVIFVQPTQSVRSAIIVDHELGRILPEVIVGGD